MEKTILSILIFLLFVALYIIMNYREVYCIESFSVRRCTENKSEFLGWIKILNFDDFYIFDIYQIDKKINKSRLFLSNRKDNLSNRKDDNY